jgi:hypothetical protein
MANDWDLGQAAEQDLAAAGIKIDQVAVGRKLLAAPPAQIETYAQRLIVFTVIHELGHATGAGHHGEKDYFAFSNEKQDPACSLDNYDPAWAANGFTQAMWKQCAAVNKAYQSWAYGGGARTCPMRYWQLFGFKTDVTPTHPAPGILLFVNGWDPSKEPPQGGTWKFCDENWPTMACH